MRILVAEDESELLAVLTKRLKEEGYATDGCSNGIDALHCLQTTPYDLAILDILMPGKDGLAVLQALRAGGNQLPVLLLTARDSVEHRVTGLDAGADDYLTKPFAFAELLARIRVLLRRGAKDKTDILALADLTMELSTHRVQRAGKEISLSSKEFAVLEYLLRHKGMVLSRGQLESHVWDYDFAGGSNIVDVYVRYLRRKIDDPFGQKLIHTVRGVGYMLKESP